MDSSVVLHHESCHGVIITQWFRGDYFAAKVAQDHGLIQYYLPPAFDEPKAHAAIAMAGVWANLSNGYNHYGNDQAVAENLVGPDGAQALLISVGQYLRENPVAIGKAMQRIAQPGLKGGAL